MESVIWLVLANAVEAVVYKIDKSYYLSAANAPLTQAHHLSNDLGRLKTSELIENSSQHYRFDGQHHATGMGSSDAHEHNHQKFAKEIADFLEKARNNHEYSSLVLCAEPHFYGLLNKRLTDSVSRLIEKHILKDYAHLTGHHREDAVRGVIKDHIRD